MKIFLIGYYGRHNLGDDAILDVMLNNFNKIFKNLEVTIETADSAEYIKQYFGFYKVNKSNSILFSILKNDLIIFGGGGLLSDAAANKWMGLLGMTGEMFLAKLLGKKVLLIGVGVDTPHFWQTKVIYKMDGKIADLIAVRDNNSYKILKKLNIKEGKLIKSYDLALLFFEDSNNKNQYVAPEEICRLKKPIIGVNFFDFPKRKIADNSKQKKFDDGMILFINGLIKKYGGSILFLAASRGDYDTKDYLCMKKIFDKIQTGNKLIYNYENPFKTISFLKKCDYIIAMKLHISVLGYILKKKIIGISYNSKVVNFYEEIGRENCCIDIDDFFEKNARNIFEKTLGDDSDNNLLESAKMNIAEVFKKVQLKYGRTENR